MPNLKGKQTAVYLSLPSSRKWTNSMIWFQWCSIPAYSPIKFLHVSKLPLWTWAHNHFWNSMCWHQHRTGDMTHDTAIAPTSYPPALLPSISHSQTIMVPHWFGLHMVCKLPLKKRALAIYWYLAIPSVSGGSDQGSTDSLIRHTARLWPTTIFLHSSLISSFEQNGPVEAWCSRTFSPTLSGPSYSH